MIARPQPGAVVAAAERYDAAHAAVVAYIAAARAAGERGCLVIPAVLSDRLQDAHRDYADAYWAADIFGGGNHGSR
jgi:hypothetical protein